MTVAEVVRAVDARTSAIVDGPTYLVRVEGDRVESVPADASTPAGAVIESTSRDLLALLLGRPLHRPPVITGDAEFARAFSRAFPGP